MIKLTQPNPQDVEQEERDRKSAADMRRSLRWRVPTIDEPAGMYVAWTEGETFIAEWDGSAWQELATTPIACEVWLCLGPLPTLSLDVIEGLLYDARQEQPRRLGDHDILETDR